MIPTSDRLSRWTPAIFVCALVNFGFGLALSVSGFAWPLAPASAPASLAMVHTLTIGWLTLLMFGALFQFVPVITARALPSQIWPLATLIGVESGLVSMIGGFLALGRGGAAALLLPAGGGLVTLAVLLGAGALLVPLIAKRPAPLSARFVLAGLGFLLLTVLLGLAFAVALTVPALGPALGPGLAVLLGDGLGDHVLAGIGGWFTLTAIGVSYELLPMFMLAPHDRGALGVAVLVSGAGGFFVAFGAGLGGIISPGGGVWLAEQIGRLAIVLALGLYLLDVARLYRSRRRQQIELHNRAAIGAFVALGLAVLLALGAVAFGHLTALAPTLVLLLLLGWLSGLGVTQLYKIVAFLAWLSRYGSQLGRHPVPRVQDLVNEPGSRGVFALYFASVAIAALAAMLGWPEVTRAALALTLLAVALLGREYLRAWRAHYARAAKPAPERPLPIPPPQGARR